MVLVVVVRVGEDGLALLEKSVHQTRPVAQILGPVFLEMRVAGGELATVSQPGNVGEVRGGLFEPGHPRVIYEGMGRPMLAQQVGEVGAEPAPVAHLDGVEGAFGKLAQERLQSAHALDRETGRELEKQGAKPVVEALHRADEALGGFFAADQALFVRDLLGVLYVTDKRAHAHAADREIARFYKPFRKEVARTLDYGDSLHTSFLSFSWQSSLPQCARGTPPLNPLPTPCWPGADMPSHKATRMLKRRAAWHCTFLARGFHYDRTWISVLHWRLRGSSLRGDEISENLLPFWLQVISIVHEEVRPVGARGVPVYEHSVRIPPHTLC